MTKIFVIKRKHLLYGAIALIVFVLLIVFALTRKDDNEQTEETGSHGVSEASAFIPGVYTGRVELGNYDATLEVLIDSTQVKNVRFISTDEAVETMYPLAESTLSSINDSLRSGAELEMMSADDTNGYTYNLIMGEIESILDKARTN